MVRIIYGVCLSTIVHIFVIFGEWYSREFAWCIAVNLNRKKSNYARNIDCIKAIVSRNGYHWISIFIYSAGYLRFRVSSIRMDCERLHETLPLCVFWCRCFAPIANNVLVVFPSNIFFCYINKWGHISETNFCFNPLPRALRKRLSLSHNFCWQTHKIYTY